MFIFGGIWALQFLLYGVAVAAAIMLGEVTYWGKEINSSGELARVLLDAFAILLLYAIFAVMGIHGGILLRSARIRKREIYIFYGTISLIFGHICVIGILYCLLVWGNFGIPFLLFFVFFILTAVIFLTKMSVENDKLVKKIN